MEGVDSVDSETVEVAEPRQDVAQLEEVLRGINAELAGLHEQSRFLNQVVDRLHTENENLRRQDSQKVLQPALRELIRLADGWRSRAAALRGRQEPDAAKLAGLCDEVVDDVCMILDRQGVEEFRPEPGVSFDRHEHRAVGTRETSDGSLDGSVAEVRRPGYRVDGRVVRFAEVLVLRSTAAGGLDDDGPGGPPRDQGDDGHKSEPHGGHQ